MDQACGIVYFFVVRKMVSAVLLVASSLCAHAHPHMWIDGSLDFDFNASGLSGVKVRWVFDAFNSAEMLTLWDRDGDGQLTGGEVELVRDSGFAHLYDNGYFILAQTTGSELEIPVAGSFNTRVDDGKLIYEFSVPLQVRWNLVDGLTLGFFDRSYYIDFASVSERTMYNAQGRSVSISAASLSLATEGWGTVNVPALKLGVR